MNAAAVQKFSYDPFDPAVMADPLPYYRVLREHDPVYYLPQWDTFALSRFADIWDVLAINDGTLVASEDTLPPATAYPCTLQIVGLSERNRLMKSSVLRFMAR